jgi:lipoprotein-anchoring transpeptidase ErfK/SrfK
MLSRRHLLLSGLATVSVAASGAVAHEGSELVEVLPPELMPQIVPVQAGLPPGEIHVDPNRFALYWTLSDQMAVRYACGIGRPGLYEPGVFYVGAKKEWPSWTPTPDMIEREPEHYAQYADGMPGGPDNPLGARALYLFTPERGDTFLRIHGTNAPETIGTAVSNGCARLVNAQIMELYNQVPLDTRVVLYPPSEPLLPS